MRRAAAQFRATLRQSHRCSPIGSVQRLRVEEAKRRLEGSGMPVDEISWTVGYEDAAFFRRLFERMTGLTPRTHRRKFRFPAFAQAGPGRNRSSGFSDGGRF